MMIDVDVSVAAFESADDVDAERSQEATRRFKAGGGVVIAGNDDDVELRAEAFEAEKRVVEELHGLAGRVLAVEDIACDDHCVDRAFHQQTTEAFENLLVFEFARIAAQGLADVPVGCVNNAHRLPRSI